MTYTHLAVKLSIITSDNLSKYQFIKELESQPFVKAIYLFGSRAQNNYRQNSDIDLCIVCPTASENEWERICDIIEDSDTLLQIDCLRYDKVSDPILRQNIDRNHIVLFKR